MFHNERRFDYGLRGAPQRSRERTAPLPDRRQDAEQGARTGDRRPDRVTDPYSHDYVYGGRGARIPRNSFAYSDDHPGRLTDRNLEQGYTGRSGPQETTRYPSDTSGRNSSDL
jgi:hypothetical protein